MRKSQNQLRNKCDKLMQEIGRKKYKSCLLCSRPNQVLHHFFPKSISAILRYDWDNLIPLCNGCHMRLHMSGDPSYQQEIIQKKGQDWYNKLVKIRHNLIKVNTAYYMAKLVELQDLSTT